MRRAGTCDNPRAYHLGGHLTVGWIALGKLTKQWGSRASRRLPVVSEFADGQVGHLIGADIFLRMNAFCGFAHILRDFCRSFVYLSCIAYT